MRTIKFELNELETKRAIEFQNSHLASCSTHTFRFIFTPTGIGDDIQLEWRKCKAKYNVTDIDSWWGDKMPFYDYKCIGCGKEFEYLSKFSDTASVIFPDCGALTERQVIESMKFVAHGLPNGHIGAR